MLNKNILINVLKPIITIVISLFIGVLLMLPTGTSPLEAYRELFLGAFGSLSNIYNTLARSTPVLFTGLAAAIAFKAGVFNIGIEGQLYVGALAAALTGIYLGNIPAFILIPMCFLSAGVAGMIWAYIPGILNSKLKINIVIVCIMMNSIAQLSTEYLATFPFRGELPMGATFKINENAMLQRFTLQSEFNIGFIFAVLLAIILYIIVFKTKFGYEGRALGLNARFAKYIGVHIERKMLTMLFISGMIAGFAGAEQVMGVNHRFISNFSVGYGFTGITVALLAKHNPLSVIITAIFFGALSQGSIYMEIMTNVSKDLISSLQAIMIILLAAEHFILPKIKLNKRGTKCKQ